MFWRFGFSAASGIDSLLDKEDVSLEAILDEDELLQECKSQNTRLIDYFQRVDVLQRLLGYVTGQIECEERGQFKYPYVATEVLCSEIWSIVETCINEQRQLLAPFWDSLLDRSPEDMKTQMVMASHFAKINAIFLSKKPAEMLAFIQSQPNVVERILHHIENPSFVDLLWLSSQNLMAQLIERLAPQHPPELHVVVADLIKGIISLATPSPGSSVSEGLQNGTSSNLFARELARHDSVSKLVAYALQDFGPGRNVASEDDQDDKTHPPLPTFESATSSVIQSIGVVIELIRKNNSDYFEPYLFHTLRNRLMQIQHQYSSQPEHVTREALERAMGEMVDRMGVVHLGPVLEIMNDNLHKFLEYLKSPRSSTGLVGTTVGMVLPLTFERFRICEMIAELLHCSNMSLLNRPPEQNKIYDSQGRLTGGLAGLEELAKLVDVPDGPNNDSMDDIVDDMEPSLDLPVTRSSHSPSSLDSDEDMSDDDAMEEIIMHDEPPAITPPGLSPSEPPPMLPSNTDSSVTGSNTQEVALSRVDSRDTSSDSDASSTIGQRSQSSRRNSKRFTIQEPPLNKPIFVGEKMKARLLELTRRPCPISIRFQDLFFEYPWNNFLHSAVYDIIHQILTGNLESGYNRELAISLFRDARLMYRIVEGQKHNDIESAKPKGVRLGYMGHLQLISEDVLIALEVFPPETKRRDNILLGGGKPIVGPERLEESSNGLLERGQHAESSADFGAPMDDDEDDEDDTAPGEFARYLAHEMNADNFGSDDEDEDGGWLSRSTFTLGNPPAAARHQQSERRPLSVNGFDDEFDPGHRSSSAASEDPFSSADDDAFGPFSDSAAVSSNDAFFSSLSDEMEDSTFDNFGDFGDFQSASPSQDGELTPTAGSWSFASDSSEGATSSSDGSPKPQGRSLREGEERSP
ncbi:SIT4 phosphatase-associated protein-domain-containing protein [Desarmillaria tabescens]|uniref:SIT4 phosphatase-associated protein-domain-containing protein n=1 Tax=Armillaria tabescens TaxID=1929756 RepID=A0AA39NDG8_ARMTA|nr:SIT4 phosphatase-associated protein-domain-containing protein [Desarmillaria tabescens]KAK0463504.1 SIT4 phosphatase-associated protein-domain-containing protein [Desarmillaria tabescens]